MTCPSTLARAAATAPFRSSAGAVTEPSVALTTTRLMVPLPPMMISYWSTPPWSCTSASTTMPGTLATASSMALSKLTAHPARRCSISAGSTGSAE